MPSSSQSYQQSRSLSNHTYRTSQDPPLLPPSHAPMHLDPYAQPYHHFVPRGTPVPPPFFNFPFPHPFLNPRSTVAAATASSSRFHHHSMKYPHHHPSHLYPTHQSQYSYHPHLQRQQQYNNSNYMSSRNQHSFNR
ncbi:hypothetical protein I4U23_017740 [Adineta vaga]|nr:hypothetical protein I4U23_017740 [Adineta vaga]